MFLITPLVLPTNNDRTVHVNGAGYQYTVAHHCQTAMSLWFTILHYRSLRADIKQQYCDVVTLIVMYCYKQVEIAINFLQCVGVCFIGATAVYC